MTRERPILFSATMVLAILEGRKTQTRRIVKPQPYSDTFFGVCHYHATCVDEHGNQYPSCNEDFGIVDTDGEWCIKCPYGEPGDRLWIKTGYSTRYDERLDTTYWSIDSGFVQTHGKPLSKNGNQKRDRKHPGMFMPFWLSQQLALPTLEIIGVRVERLQDISEADAMAEGITDGGCLNCGESEPCGCQNPRPDARDAFSHLWQSINGPESWSANPWVWVIEFKKEEN